MRTICSRTLAIAMADKAGTLRLVTREGRFGPYICIEDDHGVIETADTRREADTRIATIRELIA